MTATKSQIIQLQSFCSSKFRSRDERLEAVSEILGTEVDSFSNLQKVQADDLLYYFRNGVMPNNATWAFFDRHNSKHRTILSHCHTLGWKSEENPAFVDLHRLGGWLKSKSPIRKPLKAMNSAELSKVIFALEQITKKQFK